MPTVIVYWARGRDTKQKQYLARRITDAFVEEAGANRDNVLIIFQNIEPGDAVRGSQLDQPQNEQQTPGTLD